MSALDTVVVPLVSAAMGGGLFGAVRVFWTGHKKSILDQSELPQKKDAAYLSGADQAVLTMGRVLEAANVRADELEERSKDLEKRLDHAALKVDELTKKLDQALARVATVERERDVALAQLETWRTGSDERESG